MRRKLTIAALAVGLAVPGVTQATETVTYTYDANGRVIKVVHTGTVNNNVQTCYKLDDADNRVNVKVTVGSTPTCPV